MDEPELDVPAPVARPAHEVHFSSLVLDNRFEPIGPACRTSRQPAEKVDVTVRCAAGGRSPPLRHCALLSCHHVFRPSCSTELCMCMIASVVVKHTSVSGGRTIFVRTTGCEEVVLVVAQHRTASRPMLDGTLRALELEHGLTRSIVRAVLLAVPACVAVWVGLIALAISFTTAGFVAPLVMGAGIGVLAGLFYGAWAGFVSYAKALEELDRDAISGGAPALSSDVGTPETSR
jgi:hypothetical protein